MRIITIRPPQPKTTSPFPFFEVTRHPAPFLSTSTSHSVSHYFSNSHPYRNQSYISSLRPWFSLIIFPLLPIPGWNSSGRSSDILQYIPFLYSHPTNSWNTHNFRIWTCLLGSWQAFDFRFRLCLYSSHLSSAWLALRRMVGLGHHLCSSTWFWLGLAWLALHCLQMRGER